MLPENPEVLLMQANGIFAGVGCSVCAQKRRIEILDFAETITPQFEGVCILAQRGFPGIKGVLPEMHRRRVAVGNHHVRERGAMQDRSVDISIAVADIVENQTVDRMGRDANLPLLPADRVAIDCEARSLGLGDLEWLEILANLFHLIGCIVGRFGWYRVHAMVKNDGVAAVDIHQPDQPLDRPRIVIVIGVLVEKGERTQDASGGHLGWMNAGDPGFDMNQGEIFDATFRQGGQPLFILEKDAVEHSDVVCAQGCLTVVNPLEARDIIKRQRYACIEALPSIAVVPDELNDSLQSSPGSMPVQFPA